MELSMRHDLEELEAQGNLAIGALVLSLVLVVLMYLAQ